jgi:hypothetical protein
MVAPSEGLDKPKSISHTTRGTASPSHCHPLQSKGAQIVTLLRDLYATNKAKENAQAEVSSDQPR